MTFDEFLESIKNDKPGAGRKRPDVLLEEEWELLVREMLNRED